MKRLPGILLITTGVLLFLAAAFQVFSFMLSYLSTGDPSQWADLLPQVLVIIALCVLAFFSVKAGRDIISRQQ